MASVISSSGMAPPISNVFQPERPMYGITRASSGYRSSHSSAVSRLAPHLTPTESVSPDPRNAKILLPTLATTSPSHGSSFSAPGLAREQDSQLSHVMASHYPGHT